MRDDNFFIDNSTKRAAYLVVLFPGQEKHSLPSTLLTFMDIYAVSLYFN